MLSYIYLFYCLFKFGVIIDLGLGVYEWLCFVDKELRDNSYFMEIFKVYVFVGV